MSVHSGRRPTTLRAPRTPATEQAAGVGSSQTILPVPQPGTIRILIADGERPHRRRIRATLETQADFTVVAEADDGVEAVRRTFELRPDILLLDVSIAQLTGLEVLRTLWQAEIDVRTILLVMDLPTTVLVDMLRLGARGYMSRSASPDVLLKSIRKVSRNELWIGRETMSEVVRALTAMAVSRRAAARRGFGLTRREHEILALAIEGETNRRIAQRLSLSRDTVKHHLSNIFDKTGVSTRLELALFAMHHHLVDAGRK